MCVCCLNPAAHPYIIVPEVDPQIKGKEQRLIGTDQDNVSDWGELSIHRLLFQWASTIKIQLSVLL
jgi:hypothetical protein